MYRKYVKRLLDILCCLIALPFFAVIFLFVVPAIKLSDGGPVFYNAPRLGKNGKVFNMYKFRSMRVNAPDIRNADGSTYNSADDFRVTRVGKFLRETSLDETPQLFNVLKGDMSIVGPRPHLATNYVSFELLPEQSKRRLAVLPGVTGYTQAYYRNNAPAAERDAMDVYYAENISLLFDIKIIYQTVLSVLKRENIYIESTEKNEKGHKL